MERNHILQELQGLRILLNQGNKLANEKTELRFKIERVSVSECRLLIAIVGQSDEHQIEVSRRDQHGNWERSGFTSFKKLENFCSEYLRNWEKTYRKSKGIKREISESDIALMISHIQKDFDSQLIDYPF